MNVMKKMDRPLAARVQIAPFDPNDMKMPWIARIDEWEGQAPLLTFGGYTRNDWDDLSTGGVLEVAARPGDLVRWGQRSRSGPGRMTHGLVMPDYTVKELTTGEAHKAWRGRAVMAAEAESLSDSRLRDCALEAMDLLYALWRDDILEPAEVQVLQELSEVLGEGIDLTDNP